MDTKIGSVTLGSKIDTQGVEKGSKEIKKEFEGVSEAAGKVVEKVNQEFDNFDTSQMEEMTKRTTEVMKEEFSEAADKIADSFEELPEPCKDAFNKISQILDDGVDDQKTKAAKIADVFKGLGQDSSTAMSKAWDVVKSESEEGAKIVIENLKDIQKEAEETGRKIGGDGGTGGGGNSLISGLIGGLTSAVAQEAIQILKDVGQAVFEFGKEAIDLGSDLQEVQNVVDETFTSMSGKVNEFAQNADKSAGLSETMAKKYVGTFGAMADSFGFSEKKAYEMSTTLTQLTGDVASFYNLDHDGAYTKLKAVFTGETESLKELGVVMTQTALDDYAMRNGFEKTTAQMTEQEKVALRYEFVLDQLNNAAGDFARTQDSWANQTRILNLQWESFQATIGEGLINAFTPTIQFINNDVMPLLQTWADKFAAAFEPKPADDLRESMDKLKDSFDRADEKFKATTAEIEANAVMAKVCADELAKLETAGLKTTESQKKYEAVIKRLNKLLPDLNLEIDQHTGLVKGDTEAIYANIEAIKAQMEQMAEQEILNELQEEYKNSAKTLYEAEYELYVLENERTGLIQMLASQMKVSYEDAELLATGYAEMNRELSLSDVLYKELGSIFLYLNPENDKLIENIIRNKSEQEALNAEIETAKTKLDEAYTALDGYSQKLEDSASYAETAKSGQMTVSESVEYTTGKVKELMDAYDATYASVQASIDNQISMFDKLSEESDITAEEIVENAEKTTAAYSDYNKNLQTLVDRGVPRKLAAQFADCSKESIETVEVLANASDSTLQEFVAVGEGFAQVQDELTATITDLYEGTTEKLKNIEQEFRDVFGEDIPQEVKDGIREAQSHIDNLKGKSVDVTVTTTYVTKYETIGSPSSTPTIGGFPRTYNADPALAASYEPAAMNALPVAEPYLAAGTVVPPMATFPAAAAFSSMRSADNEELIREIVRAENSGLSDGLDDVNENLNTLIGIVSNMNLDGNMIFNSYNDRERKMAIVRGVKR